MPKTNNTTKATEIKDTASGERACSLLNRVFDMVKEHGPRKAVEDGETSFTYSELDDLSSNLARRLVQLNEPVYAPVGVYLDRSWHVPVAFLAAAKSGCPYVPLDPTWPSARLEYVLKNTGMKTMLVRNDALPPEDVSSGLTLVEVQTGYSNAEDTELPPIEDAAPLYIMYTSGSTGTPKGVVVSHSNVLHFATATPFPGFTSGNRMSGCISAAFDASVTEIWGSMLNGCTLVCTAKDTFLEVGRCNRYLRENAIDYGVIPVSIFNLLASQNPSIFSEIKTLIIGGEQPDNRMCKAVMEEGPPKQFYNSYGPTECTVSATAQKITTVDQTTAIPAGSPLKGVSLYIVDQQLAPVKQGVKGEILIGGTGVSLGYFKNDEINRTAFISLPGIPEKRVYRTGDMGCLDEKGVLTIAGRRDDQIKVAGNRLELGEVRKAINAAPVVLRGHATHDKKYGIIAYVVPVSGLDKTTRDTIHTVLHGHLAKQLPVHALPSHTILLEDIPLNANGKIDTQALPKPIYDKTDSENTSEILTILRTGLRNHAYEAQDSFLGMGGNSLLAAHLASKVSRATGVRVPLELFMQEETAFLVQEYIDLAQSYLIDQDIPKATQMRF